MKRLFYLLIALFLASCSKVRVVPSESGGEELADLKKGAEIVRVNDTSIREGYLDVLSAINPRVKSQVANPTMKKKMVENLVDQELLYQESLRRGLDQKKEVLDKAGLYRRIIVAQAVMEAEMEQKAREYYEKHKDTDFTKVSVSQIQIDFKKPEAEKTPPADKDKKGKNKEATAEEKRAALEKAKAVKARLISGEDFGKVAEEASDDKSSSKKGGDLGPISRDDKRLARRGMDKVVEAAFKLKNGEVSDIIETARAWHIVKVTSEPEATPFEEAKKTIEFQLQKQVKDDLLASLKQSAKIVYAEEAKPSAPAPAKKEENSEAPKPAVPTLPAAEAPVPPAPGDVTEAPAPAEAAPALPAAPAPIPAVEAPTAGPVPPDVPPEDKGTASSP
ncbi:MAG: peptidylprolyl isomerase [Deltaproteobacteria bacterium]|nr:peptidylprolyl isomerase [Deltaproteobacteria bacterium]